MKKEDLLIYESPSISEFVSIGFFQDIIAGYLAWKINRKWRRYDKRIVRANNLISLEK